MKLCAMAAMVAICGVGCAGVAQAAVFNSEASFLASIQPLHLHETFQTSVSGPPSFSLSSNGYTVQFTTAAQAFLVFDFAGDRYLTTSGATDGFSRPVTLSFTSGNVTAVGGSFFQTSAGGAFLSSPVTLNFSDGTSQTLTPGAVSDFFGYTSAVPISSLTISPDASHHFVSLDNLRVGTVPAPAGLAAMLVGAAVCTRRQRARLESR